MKSLTNHDILGRYLSKVLRPFARFAVRKGLRMPDVLETLRAAFVAVAADELKSLSVRPSTSRLAVTTGLSRREVQRVYEASPQVNLSISLPSRVVGLWSNHKSFVAKNGKPRALSFEGADSDFTRLVRLVSQDIHPASVLFELERVGLVERTPRGIVLTRDSFQSRDPEDGIRMLSEDLDSLLTAVDENLFGDGTIRNLHVRTVSTQIASSKAAEVREWLLREGGAFHRRIRDYLAEHDLQLNPPPQEESPAQVLITSFGRVIDPPKK